jgi:phosphate transport system substrate-binding protein
MSKGAILWAAAVFCVLTTGVAGAAEELKIGAGAAPVENVLKPVRTAFEKATGIRLSITPSGPKLALLDLERGSVDAAAAGLTLSDWLALMKKEGAEVKDPASLSAVTIGRDRIVVITNKANPVKKLSREQLQGIFTGKIESWKEVGGEDLPILIVWGKLIQGTNSMFVSKILDGKAQAKEVIDATTAEDVRQNVAANPSAIGIGPTAILDGSINAPEVPEVARGIILVTKGKPSAKVQKLIDFIKGEGQKFIK